MQGEKGCFCVFKSMKQTVNVCVGSYTGGVNHSPDQAARMLHAKQQINSYPHRSIV